MSPVKWLSVRCMSIPSKILVGPLLTKIIATVPQYVSGQCPLGEIGWFPLYRSFQFQRLVKLILISSVTNRDLNLPWPLPSHNTINYPLLLLFGVKMQNSQTVNCVKNVSSLLNIILTTCAKLNFITLNSQKLKLWNPL